MRTNTSPFFSKKQLISIALMLSFCLSTVLFIPQVLAVDYEWIQDGGFETMGVSEIVEDGGFESGVYGWWHFENGTAAPAFDASLKHSGDYSLLSVLTTGLYRVFTVVHHLPSINTSSGSYLSYWYRGTFYNNEDFVKVNYTDGSVTSYTEVGVGGSAWANVNVSLTDYKVLDSIIIMRTMDQSGWLAFDDFSISLAGGGEIDASSEPWFTWWYNIYSEDYVGVTIDESYSGLCSAYLGYDAATYGACTINQEISYLTADNITNLSLYAKTTSTTATNIRATLYYSDGFINFINGNGTFTSADGWVFINYTLNLVPSNKFLILVTFGVISGDSGALTYVDDVSLLANVETTTSRFEFYLIPAPFGYHKGLSGFTGYTNIAYVFYGILSDVNGDATESGTFSVTSSFGLTTTSGTITNGAFQFNISPRDNALAYQDSEIFHITLTVDSGTYNVNVYATWILSWFVSPSPTSTGAPPEGQTSVLVTNFIIYFVLIFMPSILLAMEFRYRGANSLIGFFIGLTLCSAFCFLCGLIPIWFIFLDGLILIVILLSQLRRL